MKMLKRVAIYSSLLPILCSCSMLPELTYKSGTRTNSKIDTHCQFEYLQIDKVNKLQDCKKNVFYPSADGKKILAVLEMDEQGRFIDEEHAQAILNYIQHKNQNANIANIKKPIVSLYIHGWNHNSRISDEDLHSFRNAVKSLYNSQGIGRDNTVLTQDQARDSIGIYVAWRGKVIDPTMLNRFVTFWDRKTVSEEVGRGDLSRFILQLDSEIKGNEDEAKNGTLILSGHSFGASVLYNAIGPVLTSRFYESIASQKKDPNVPLKGVGDMIVLLNPAIEANRFVSLREAVWRAGVKNPQIFKNNMKPFFMIIGSNGDFPLNNLFPTGRFFGTLSENYLNTSIVEGNSSTNRLTVKERKMDRRAIGNYPEFYTHWLSIKEPIAVDALKINKMTNRMKMIVHVPDPKPWEDCKINKAWLQNTYAASAGNNWNATPNVNIYNEPVQISTEFIKNPAWKRTGLILRKEPDRTTKSEANPWKKSEATTWKNNPYWFIRANSRVISGHNAIWSKDVGCFILSVLVADSSNTTDVSITQK